MNNKNNKVQYAKEGQKSYAITLIITFFPPNTSHFFSQTLDHAYSYIMTQLNICSFNKIRSKFALPVVRRDANAQHLSSLDRSIWNSTLRTTKTVLITTTSQNIQLIPVALKTVVGVRDVKPLSHCG